MSDSKDDSDWEFSVEDDSPTPHNDSDEAPQGKVKSHRSSSQKEVKLELVARDRRRMTRAQLAKEMSKGDNIENTVNYASFKDRLMAAVTDVIAFLAIVGFVYFLSIWQISLFQMLGNIIYKDISILNLNSASLVLIFLLYILFFTIPLVGSGKSPGKFLMGISCKTSQMEPLSIFMALFREVVIKPISMVSILGALIILCNAKNKGLHDYICGTLVVKD